jgi:hypothetical protein
MSWRAPTRADLEGSLSASEIDGMKDKATGEVEDTIAQALGRAVHRTRSYCRTSGVAMGVAGTLPEELIPDAADMAAIDFLTRLNMEVKQDRRDRNAAALKRLEAVAARKLSILGAGDEETQSGAVTPKMAPRDRTLGREREVGL